MSALQPDERGSCRCCYKNNNEMQTKRKRNKEIIEISLLWRWIRWLLNPRGSVGLHSVGWTHWLCRCLACSSSALPHCGLPLDSVWTAAVWEETAMWLLIFCEYLLFCSYFLLPLPLSPHGSFLLSSLFHYLSHLSPSLACCRSTPFYLSHSSTHPPTAIWIWCHFAVNHVAVVSRAPKKGMRSHFTMQLSVFYWCSTIEKHLLLDFEPKL